MVRGLLHNFCRVRVGLLVGAADHLDDLIAAKPEAVEGAGIVEASPAAWVVGAFLHLGEVFESVCGLDRRQLGELSDKADGTLAVGGATRDKLLSGWNAIRQALGPLELPDRERIRVGLARIAHRET
jgi:hypothetical protein